MDKPEEGKRIHAILVSDVYGRVSYPNKTADICEFHTEWYGNGQIAWGFEYKDSVEVRRWNLLTVQMIEWES